MNAVADVGRRSARRALAEIHYRLRTECDTPLRKAGAVFIGVAIGCLPVYGLHLLLCVLLARLVGVNRITAYLASYINNPITAPLIVYLEFGLGYSLFHGYWPVLNLAELSSIGLWDLGRDLAVGSLVLGGVLGLIMAVVAFLTSQRMRRHPLERRLIEATAKSYLPTGILNWEFVRGKLRYDPLYLALLKLGLLPERGRLLDLGCGRGILLTLLRVAKLLHAEGDWATAWPAPPQALELTGIDSRGKDVAVARVALKGSAEIHHVEVRDYRLPPCEVAVLLDVLLYLQPEEQQDIIAHAAAVLSIGGLLLIREADADAGWRFTLTRGVERLCALTRGHWRQRYHYRGAGDWAQLLKAYGFTVDICPMSAGTPYANVLFIAHKY